MWIAGGHYSFGGNSFAGLAYIDRISEGIARNIERSFVWAKATRKKDSNHIEGDEHDTEGIQRSNGD